MDLNQKIVNSLERISQAFRVLLWNESKEYGLSPIQIQILIFLFTHSPEKRKISYLAREFDMTKATISDSVKVLFQKSLVTKEFEGAKISGSYIATVAKDPKLLNMDFFNWYSQLPYFYHQALISSYGVHIEKMTFDFDTFLQLEMKLPSIEEQTAIAQVLQAADNEISMLKAKAEKLREQKKGLMQVLLTGKVRLKIN